MWYLWFSIEKKTNFNSYILAPLQASYLARISIVPSHVFAQPSFIWCWCWERLPYFCLFFHEKTVFIWFWPLAVKREQKMFQEEDCAINMNLNLQPLLIDIQGLNKFELSCWMLFPMLTSWSKQHTFKCTLKHHKGDNKNDCDNEKQA